MEPEGNWESPSRKPGGGRGGVNLPLGFGGLEVWIPGLEERGKREKEEGSTRSTSGSADYVLDEFLIKPFLFSKY